MFTDYTELMDDMMDMADKMKVLERENYQLRQSSGSIAFTSSTAEMMADFSDKPMDPALKTQYENQIKALEKKLLSVQDSQLG